MNLFNAIFTHDPSSPAIFFGRRKITYGELRAETLKMAHLIRSFGIERGDRVALLLNDSPEFVEAFIATCSLGAIAVPINMALRAEEQCSILHNSGASFALMEARLLLATIAQRYRLSLAPGQVVAKDPLITLGTKHGMRMRLEQRMPKPLPEPELSVIA